MGTDRAVRLNEATVNPVTEVSAYDGTFVDRTSDAQEVTVVTQRADLRAPRRHLLIHPDEA
ncbi:MAG: hypothetical protein F4Z54_06510 [Acidimicrobiaceae bacterium]|nr:hypothetical protein [Acidimicrobiaceae bacterium]